MRFQVRIETLSSVHVGSGDKKVRGIDFVNDDNRVYFLDVNKIGEALGVASNPNIASQWVKRTLEGQQEKFLKEKGVDYKKMSRAVPNYVKDFSDRAPSISMQMRDGRGMAYIPGSSIKGAIRTILFALLGKSELKRMHNSKQDELIDWGKEFFGKIPNDPFRFLHVGDAIFENAEMAVINTVQIKKDKKNQRFAAIDTIKQYAEVLLRDNNSIFVLTIDEAGYERACKAGLITRSVPQFQDAESLFSTINSHTENLLKSELDKWNEIKGAESMCDYLRDIIDEIDACQANECVIRLGNASGKRFITGGVLEGILSDMTTIPKTRRIEIVEDEDEEFYELLGFVKLTIL